MAKKGYWVVVHVGATDGAVMAEYGKAARPVVESGGGRLIIRGKPAKACEAAIDEPVVVVEFESLAKAIEVYEGAAYQAAAKILAGKVKRDFRIVEGT
jgi:uncharacterized protein (DUF1330 family)